MKIVGVLEFNCLIRRWIDRSPKEKNTERICRLGWAALLSCIAGSEEAVYSCDGVTGMEVGVVGGVVRAVLHVVSCSYMG